MGHTNKKFIKIHANPQRPLLDLDQTQIYHLYNDTISLTMNCISKFVILLDQELYTVIHDSNLFLFRQNHTGCRTVCCSKHRIFLSDKYKHTLENRTIQFLIPKYKYFKQEELIEQNFLFLAFFFFQNIFFEMMKSD